MTAVPAFRPDRVVELRTLRGWTQQDLAVKTGCSVRAVQDWEAGFQPAARYLRRLSELTGRPVAWFFEVQAA